MTIVFIVTLVQGWGLPVGIMPRIDRFIGITLGLVTLLAVSLLLQLFWSGPPERRVGNPGPIP